MAAYYNAFVDLVHYMQTQQPRRAQANAPIAAERSPSDVQLRKRPQPSRGGRLHPARRRPGLSDRRSATASGWKWTTRTATAAGCPRPTRRRDNGFSENPGCAAAGRLTDAGGERPPSAFFISASRGERSMKRSATTWITSRARCSLPLTTRNDERHHRAAVGGEDVAPDHRVGDAGLVLQGDEHHALGRARPLADQHQAADGDARAVPHRSSCAVGTAPRRVEQRAEEAAGVGLQRQAGGAVVLRHVRRQPHPRQRRRRPPPGPRPASSGASSFGLRLRRQRLHRPQPLAAVHPQRAEGVGLGQQLQRAAREPGAAGQVLQRGAPRRARSAPRLVQPATCRRPRRTG